MLQQAGHTTCRGPRTRGSPGLTKKGSCLLPRRRGQRAPAELPRGRRTGSGLWRRCQLTLGKRAVTWWDSESQEASLAEAAGAWPAWVCFQWLESVGVSISLTRLQQVVMEGPSWRAGQHARPGSALPRESLPQWSSFCQRVWGVRGGHVGVDVREGVGGGGPGTPHLQGGTGPEPCRGLCTSWRDGPGSRTTGATGDPHRVGEPREVGKGAGLFGWQGLRWGPQRALSIFTW